VPTAAHFIFISFFTLLKFYRPYMFPSICSLTAVTWLTGLLLLSMVSGECCSVHCCHSFTCSTGKPHSLVLVGRCCNTDCSTDWMIQGSTPGTDNCPDHLHGPPSLLFNGYHWFFPLG